MKAAWIEFRMYIAEVLLSWVFDIAPDKEGRKLKTTILIYFTSNDLKKTQK